MSKDLALKLCTRWGGCPSQSVLSTLCPNLGRLREQGSGNSNLFWGLADSWLRRRDVGSESTFSTQTRDTVTTETKNLRKRQHRAEWHLEN